MSNDSEYVRHALDFYETPQDLATSICERLASGRPPKTILEPSAGTGSFVRAARVTWPQAEITAIDLNTEHGYRCQEAGATEFRSGDFRFWKHQDPNKRWDLIIGNPPYREAQDHIERALGLLAPGGSLVFLLRINFLASRERLPLWNRGQLAIVTPIVPRPSFTSNGRTDGTEYAVFEWRNRESGGFFTMLQRPLVWRA